jgi:AcrR family transcriptional regulator
MSSDGSPTGKQSTRSIKDSKRGYHHGNLREELIATAIEMVGERGVDGLSVAEAARRAGVSPGAPYRHFPDRETLLAAASLAATEQMAATYRAALESSDDPVEQLAAVSAGYVRLAASTGAGYDLIYASGLERSEHEQLAESTRELGALVLPPARELVDDNAGALELLSAQMALAHGFAGLLRAGFFQARSDDSEQIARAAAQATRVLLAGYAERRRA